MSWKALTLCPIFPGEEDCGFFLGWQSLLEQLLFEPCQVSHWIPPETQLDPASLSALLQ
jgi:hypothetical protein